ncbi:tRNA_anti-like protein [bacterium BMS3Abin03]|nr:tRNA_anti-like protein [bacterium BMS3Abin03]
MKKFTNIVMLFLFLAAVYIFYIEMIPAKISAEELAVAYNYDKLSADKKFLNKEIELTGKVKAFYKLLNTRFVLELQNEGKGENIICFFNKKEDETKARQLQENDDVIIKGKCVGMDEYNFINGVKIDVSSLRKGTKK